MKKDREIVHAALAGDPAAFASLVEGNRARVEAIAKRMVGTDAEDIVQEALLRAYLGLSQLREPTRFGAWLCGITVNLAKMHLRARRSETSLIAPPGSQDAFEERELLRLVRDAVAILPPGQRDAVLMHYVEGLSCDEIAAVLESSPGAIRVRLHRARQQLREQLAPLAPVMTSREELHMIEMRLEDVIVRVADDDPAKVIAEQRIVLLRERDGERVLPIWIGAAEGNSLAQQMTGEAMPRPVTADVMAELVRVTGGRIERIAVTALREKTFYGTIAVGVEGRVDEIDARPSDALNLAVRVGAPIYVAEDVLEQSGIPPDGVYERLDAQAEEVGQEVPPGKWRSLSAELLQPLYRWP